MNNYHGFSWAVSTLKSARNEGAGKPVANNTRLYKRDENRYAVKLHAVDVVTINDDNTWTLRAEGWHTVTTLERIRRFSPARIESVKGEWYVALEPDANDPKPAYVDRPIPAPFTEPNPGPEQEERYDYEWWLSNRRYQQCMQLLEQYGTLEAWGEARKQQYRERRVYLAAQREWEQRNRVPFYDGITVDSDGYAPRLRKDGPSPAKLRKHEAAVAYMKKRIDKYVDEFIAELKKGTMPMPSGGDCWMCLFRNTDTGETWGDMGDNDHLIGHIADHYYVPSLAVNALRERGYKDVGIYMWLDMNQDTGTMGKPGGRYDNVKRDIRAYMNKRLIPNAPTS